MKNLNLKKWSGHTEVQIIGTGAERFINRLVRENVQIWDIKRAGENQLLFMMFIDDVPKIREAVRYHRVKVRFKKRAGLPFIARKLYKRMGFVIGSLFAIILIFLLSNMIWKVEIDGASPEVEYKITNQLKKMGVNFGQLQFFVEDPETLQQKLTKQNDEITWIGVDIKGTTYHFRVVEKERPEAPEATSPRNLVSKKEAIIVDYFVEEGKPMIQINDFVKPGQILVQGLLGTENQPKIVSAKGEVFGKTWYRVDTWVNMNTEMDLLTGEEKTNWKIKIGSLDIPIWGFKNAQYKDKQVEQDEKNLKFFKWTLPISLLKTTEKEKEIQKIDYNEQEAKKMAIELSKKDLEAQIPDGAKIVEEKILHESIDNGKFKLSIIYDVIENIVVEQPIISSN